MKEATYTLGQTTYTRGDTLPGAVQQACLRMFVHRFTADHAPAWALAARPDGSPYPVQFLSDHDWLANTWFAVKKDRTLDGRVRHCQSAPTWPNNPELRA